MTLADIAIEARSRCICPGGYCNDECPGCRILDPEEDCANAVKVYEPGDPEYDPYADDWVPMPPDMNGYHEYHDARITAAGLTPRTLVVDKDGRKGWVTNWVPDAAWNPMVQVTLFQWDPVGRNEWYDPAELQPVWRAT